MDESRLSIGELARRARVSVDTIRYYEKRGLLRRAERTPSGYRAFDVTFVRRVRFVREAQGLGFSLDQIRSLLDLSSAPAESCNVVRSAASARRSDIEARIERLSRMRAALDELVATCARRRPGDPCPLLDSLQEEPPHAPGR